jgi:pimeloyl-ACP methyl ester carboxylesterase
MMGLPAGWVLSPADEAAIAATTNTLLPVSPRTEGVLFDMFSGNADINRGYALDQISVPVLVVSAEDDPLALFANSQALAAQIPGSELLAVPNGGHMLLGREAEVRQAIERFLLEHAVAANASR